MIDNATTHAELIVYHAEDDRTRIEYRFESELSITHVERAPLEVG